MRKFVGEGESTKGNVLSQNNLMVPRLNMTIQTIQRSS